MISFLFLSILILWLAKAAKDIFFWTYLWQLKEYRLDRMRAHFELQSAKRLFLNKAYFAKITLLISSVFLFIGIWQFFFQIITGLMYGTFGIKSIHNAYSRKIKEPVFTKKALGILIICITGITSLALFSFTKFSYPLFLTSILLIDILLPGFVAAVIGIFKFPSKILKTRIIKKAKQKRNSLKNILVIGITGSYGKTSMKEYLSHIVSDKLKVITTKKNTNTEIGIAQMVLEELNEEYDVFIVEMGAYKEGEIKKLCDIVRPQIGILTGINSQHISLFGSLEKILKAKYELIESLPKHGLAIFNGENDYVRKMYEETTMPKRMYNLRNFSVSHKPDAACAKIDFTKEGMKFEIRLNKNKETFETNILGKHNALNIVGATLAAHGLGMNLEEIKKRVKTLQAPEHTLKIYRGINSSTIIDDTYSANPHGVFAALDVLDVLKADKKIVILYPLIELGKQARGVHVKIAVKINKVCDLCILTSSDYSREIRKNAPNVDVLLIKNPELIVEKLKKIIKENDIVLLESRIPEKIIKELIINEQ